MAQIAAILADARAQWRRAAADAAANPGQVEPLPEALTLSTIARCRAPASSGRCGRRGYGQGRRRRGGDGGRAGRARGASARCAMRGWRRTLIADVGVAGLWRLMARIEEIRRFPIVIAVAGMDAALASVLGGLAAGALIAVPTSVGYGAAESGRTALERDAGELRAGRRGLQHRQWLWRGLRGAAHPQRHDRRRLSPNENRKMTSTLTRRLLGDPFRPAVRAASERSSAQQVSESLRISGGQDTKVHFMPLSCERIGNAYSGRLNSWRFRIREGVVKRGFPNFQPGGGFPDVQALGEQGASAFKFAGRDDRSSPALPTARGGGGEPRHCALFDEIALESGQSAEDMEDQPAAGRRRIDILRKRTQTDAARVQIGDGLDEMRQRAAEPIELPHNQNVAVAHIGQGLIQPRPIGLGA